MRRRQAPYSSCSSPTPFSGFRFPLPLLTPSLHCLFWRFPSVLLRHRPRIPESLRRSLSRSAAGGAGGWDERHAASSKPQISTQAEKAEARLLLPYHNHLRGASPSSTSPWWSLSPSYGCLVHGKDSSSPHLRLSVPPLGRRGKVYAAQRASLSGPGPHIATAAGDDGASTGRTPRRGVFVWAAHAGDLDVGSSGASTGRSAGSGREPAWHHRI